MCVPVCTNSIAYEPVDKPITKVCPQKHKNRKEGCRGGSQYTPPTTTLDKPRTHTYTGTHNHSSPCLAGGDKASCTQCQPLWSQASPAGPSGSYSGVGRCGWLVPLCNSSSVSDTVQVCPLWPRLPGDCVNSPANLRKYPVGIFVKPASAAGLVFHLGSLCSFQNLLLDFCTVQ